MAKICQNKHNKLIAEYALGDMSKPIGVAGFETRLVESLPKELEGKLPSIERLEEELDKINEKASVQPHATSSRKK